MVRRRQPERRGKPESAGRPEGAGRPQQPGRPAEAGQPGHTGQPGKPEQPEQPQQPSQEPGTNPDAKPETQSQQPTTNGGQTPGTTGTPAEQPQTNPGINQPAQRPVSEQRPMISTKPKKAVVAGPLVKASEPGQDALQRTAKVTDQRLGHQPTAAKLPQTDERRQSRYLLALGLMTAGMGLLGGYLLKKNRRRQQR